MHIYAFGSVCRGEISQDSDVDLLVIGGADASQYDPDTYSIYSYDRIKGLWREGNPFAWHLFLESKLLFSSDRQDFLQSLGSPTAYKHCTRDCERFLALFRDACSSLACGESQVFDLSTIFLSMRNIATCFSLGVTERPDFSRSSALRLGPNSVSLPVDSYQVLERARVLCTRGHGPKITDEEVEATKRHMNEVYDWMKQLVEKAKEHERI
ncbi:MAG: nucleotidyltransferase [Acidobacteriaceae bacterium]|nr:nucleotidyltransferase [Acidobacteriaceae bacterium]